MSWSSAVCANCRESLAREAAFCGRCGEPAPTALVGNEYTATGGTLDAAVDRLYRERLTKALSSDFEIRGQIGDGGFGVVYEAFDRRLRRSLAVKVLRHELAEAGVERFVNEAKAVASLRHPHIVPILFFGEGEGLVFLTMPLLAGRTLRERLREGALDAALATRILREIADALTAAHRVGIVHRDLKPENVFLEGEEERVVLMDFGIAKASQEPGVTESGAVLGTPAYMSPEQFSRSADVDARTDLYALGIIGYELLVGRPPFLGPSIPTLLYQHLSEAPDASELDRAAPSAELRAVLLSCLEKDAARRPQSAVAVRESLAPLRNPVSRDTEAPDRSTLRWVWIIALCGWPPTLLRWSTPVYELLVDRPDVFRSPLSAVGAIRAFSFIPFSLVSILLTVIALIQLRRALLLPWSGYAQLKARVIRLVFGPYQSYEILLLALLFVSLFFVGTVAVPTVEVVIASLGSTPPATMLAFTRTLHLLALPLPVLLFAVGFLARHTEGERRVVRIIVRGLAACAGAFLWFVAATGL